MKSLIIVLYEVHETFVVIELEKPVATLVCHVNVCIRLSVVGLCFQHMQ